ncbi:MAG TPA: fimbrillin family protein [Dysgonamonadaceae bacterium]|nr:fimbrillin family protein [Dysgonamonadaceae bacterium]
MKLKVVFITAVVGLLYLSSCMQDHPNPLDVAEKVKVSASIERMNNPSVVNTRTIDNTWTSGDAIGIFMKKSGAILELPALAENVEYITDGSSVFVADEANEMYFPTDGSKVDFIAYYPHIENLNGLIYEVDVSDQNNLSEIDLLYSNNVSAVDLTLDGINLSFEHQLTYVVLNFSMDEPDSDLSGLKAEIMNVNRTADFSLVDGTLENPGNPESVSFNVSTDGTKAQAILLPDNDLTDKYFSIEVGSVSYSFDLSNAANITSFDKSTKYTFNIILKKGDGSSIRNVSTSIEDWITGPSENLTIYEDVMSIEGDGTEEKPYNVEQARGKGGETQVWVRGYIVGYYSSSTINTFVNATGASASTTNIALAFSSTETEKENTFPIQLSSPVPTSIRDRLNLMENPSNFHKEVLLRGDVESYYNSIGLKNAKIAILGGVRYP